MTIIDDPPPYNPAFDEPDLAPEPGPRRARPRPQTPPYDPDAEAACLGSMLISENACEAILDTGLDTTDFHVPANAHIYTAILDTITAGDTPDGVTVTPRIDPTHAPQLATLFTGHWDSKGAATYARRILHCARARRLQGHALEVANAAQTGNLDEALRRLAKLTDAVPTDDTDTSWTPLDLAPVLAGDGPPPPAMLARDDGLNLLYAGKVHAFNAESESGKSWLAQWACAERIALGEHVLYLDFEDDAPDVIGRLQALYATTEDILRYFHYIRPDDPLDPVATATLERILTDHHPTLAIIDGVTEVMVQNNWSITDNDDTARFLLALPRRIARHGTAVVLIDHVPKDREGQGRMAIGAQHKLAGINGAAYKLEVTAPFGRGRNGTARITVTKDRGGHVRGAAHEGRFVAEMRVNSLTDGHVHLQLGAHVQGPQETQVRPTTLMERVSIAIEEMNAQGIEPGRNQVIADIPGKKAFVVEALKRLVTEGWIEVVPGPNRAQLHRITRVYRVVDDPKSEGYQPAEEPPSDYLGDDL